jgi:hypothetical protein
MIDSEPIHFWFELTYSNYLVLHRSALQTMPVEWQAKFVTLLEQIGEHIDMSQMPSEFMVRAKKHGRFIHDDFADYQRGRRALPLKSKSKK